MPLAPEGTLVPCEQPFIIRIIIYQLGKLIAILERCQSILVSISQVRGDENDRLVLSWRMSREIQKSDTTGHKDEKLKQNAWTLANESGAREWRTGVDWGTQFLTHRRRARRKLLKMKNQAP